MKLVQIQESQVGLFLGESTVQVQDSIKLETLLLAIARPSALTETERAEVLAFQTGLEEGKQVQLEESEFETFEKLDILEGYLGENAVTQWFGFFFKGTSDEAVEKIEAEVSKVKSEEEYDQLKINISKLRKKINNRGDASHTIANIAVLFTPSPIALGKFIIFGLIAKHLIKSFGNADAREKSLLALTKYDAALDAHAREKGWLK